MTSPILTIFLLTYNHEKTVRETFQSILMQKTKYPFIVKILEDCSTDNTLKICQEYTAQYPDLFKLIAQPVNTKGQHMRWAMNKEIQTPYFTVIEGDDYWINENHIEKVISFMEENHDYNMYATNVLHKGENFQKSSFECQNLSPTLFGHEISLEHYIYIQTAGRVYRNIFDFNQFPSQTIEGDIYSYYLYLDKGKSFCDHEIDSVYRLSTTGAWNRLSPEEQRNSFYEIVYTASNLLNCRHAKFLLKQLPKCIFKKLEKLIGSTLTLRLYVLWYRLKHPTKRTEIVHDDISDKVNPKISICCITYNHAKFIRQALDGFMMQKTNFPFEIIIHDDASTDGTADIIREYEKKYPDIIRVTYQTENQWSKGIDVLKAFVYPKIQGQYVALCEGDDYWIDENKLQKQVDFLDTHPEFNVCFHPVKVIWEDNRASESIFPKPKFRFNKDILTLQDLLKHNFIQTNSVMYRWRLKDQENLVPNDILPVDWFLHLLHAQTGKIGFLSDVMAVYRRHAGGIWTGAWVTDEWFIKCAIPNLKFYQAVEKQFQCNKQSDMEYLTRETISVCLRQYRWEKLDELSSLFPDLYQKAIMRNNNQQNIKIYQKKYKKYRKIIIILFIVIAILGFSLIFK
ncbi:glycosyltransferase family 2 protein [Campylobacter devanensis]|uniref:glycosyltransferase family 2 protein n=1 Tax=Campylobacter devanensis TaxID=3161138 RepID=UPI00191C6F76|nr:glycosyltransferase family 2 protein [Campylobacter sp. P0111]